MFTTHDYFLPSFWIPVLVITAVTKQFVVEV